MTEKTSALLSITYNVLQLLLNDILIILRDLLFTLGAFAGEDER